MDNEYNQEVQSVMTLFSKLYSPNIANMQRSLEGYKR
jgi:hypothetical protein